MNKRFLHCDWTTASLPESWASYALTEAYAAFILVQNIHTIAERYPEEHIKPLKFFARRLEERRQQADDTVLLRADINDTKWPNLNGISMPIFAPTYRSPEDFFKRGLAIFQPKAIPLQASLSFSEVIITESKLQELFPRLFEYSNGQHGTVEVPDCVIPVMAVIQRFIDTGYR